MDRGKHTELEGKQHTMSGETTTSGTPLSPNSSDDDVPQRERELQQIADQQAADAGLYARRMTEAQEARTQAQRQAHQYKQRAEAAEAALRQLYEAALPFHQAFEFSKVLNLCEGDPKMQEFLDQNRILPTHRLTAGNCRKLWLAVGEVDVYFAAGSGDGDEQQDKET